MPNDEGAIFNVKLRGKTIACMSLSDAVDVKSAEDIFEGNQLIPHMPDELERLATVLTRYKESLAAKVLCDKAKIMRRALGG